MTHPDLLTLEHVDLVQALVAVLHSENQQRVVGAAVQHRSGLRDPAQGERLQLGLQSSQSVNRRALRLKFVFGLFT